jgi:hypothetical protein
MLQSRGFPQKGYLFVSFRGEQLGVRGINDMLKGVVQKGFNGRAKDWKTKHLRDAFMNGLLQGKVTQELKDAMTGHKRQGARDDYAITELTVRTAYSESFRYLTINGYGSQSRKLEELRNQMNDKEKQDLERFRTLLDKFEKQDKEIADLRKLVLFQMREKKMDKAAVESLLKELNEKDTETEQ